MRQCLDKFSWIRFLQCWQLLSGCSSPPPPRLRAENTSLELHHPSGIAPDQQNGGGQSPMTRILHLKQYDGYRTVTKQNWSKLFHSLTQLSSTIKSSFWPPPLSSWIHMRRTPCPTCRRQGMHITLLKQPVQWPSSRPTQVKLINATQLQTISYTQILSTIVTT